MKKYEWTLLVMIVLGLSACAKNTAASNDESPNETVTQITEINHYHESTVLRLMHTGDELTAEKNNLLLMSGTGRESTYEMTYQFNSGDHTQLKLIQTMLSSERGDCNQPNTKLVLKNGDQSREVNILQSIPLNPYTDYLLDVSVGQSCEKLSLNFGVIAWIGYSMSDPRLAEVCSDDQGRPANFIPGANLMTATSSIPGKEKLLGIEDFCGEHFEGTEKTCSLNDAWFPMGESTVHPEVKCESKKGSETRSFSVEMDPLQKTVSVKCTAQNQPTFSAVFGACRSLIVDGHQ